MPESEVIRVLGVDPGLTRCGWGIVDVDSRRSVRMVAVGVARSNPELAVHFRLLEIERELQSCIDTHKPNVIAVERVFAQDNKRSITGTAQVSGIAMLEAARRGLPLALHTPSEVKAAVTGSGPHQKRKCRRWWREFCCYQGRLSQLTPLMRWLWLSAMVGGELVLKVHSLMGQ